MKVTGHHNPEWSIAIYKHIESGDWYLDIRYGYTEWFW